MESSQYPREKYIESHPRGHKSLKLKPAQKPYHCGGCKEYEIDLQPCYQCEDQKCDFHLHKECDPLSDSIWLQFINCTFTFEKEAPRGERMVCDGCGKDVKGWFYQCLSQGNPRYLHSCCAKLNFYSTVTIPNGSNIKLDLKEKTKSVCRLCGNKGDAKDFRSWVYVSRCGNYCYHVSCMKNKVEKFKKEEASNQQPSYERALVRRAPNQDVQPRRREPALDPFFKMVVDILNVLISVIFGIPALPVLSVAEWIIKKR